jgi:5-methylcytosine-specific restriction enzyme subunit McrC
VTSVVLREWDSVFIPGSRLTSEDRRLIRTLTEHDSRRLAVEELVDGVRIESTSWVGVARLDSVEIRIVPKLPGRTLDLARMLDVAFGLDALSRFDVIRSLAAEGINLFDLLAALLSEETSTLIRDGLISDYMEHEEDLPVVRGRVLWDRQLLQRFGRLDRIECRFDERTLDIAENRVLAAALGACTRRVADQAVRRSVQRSHAVLSSQTTPPADPLRLRNGISYNRLNRQYRSAHDIAWLILEHISIDDPLSSGHLRSFTFMLDMNVIFEKFVHRAFEWALEGTGLEVEYQKEQSAVLWDVRRHKTYGRLKPDLLIHSPATFGRSFPVDVKYKKYTDKKVSPDDLYQLLTYAFGFTGSGEIGRAALVYPSSGASADHQHVQLRRGGDPAADVQVRGLYIPQVLDEMEAGNRDGEVARSMRALAIGTLEGVA